MARKREPAAEEWEDVATELYELVVDHIGWDTEACEEYREVRSKANRARRP